MDKKEWSIFINKKGLFINLKEIFTKYAVEIYSGIVDDPRNTDNAWMETSVYHLHIENIDIEYLNMNI